MKKYIIILLTVFLLIGCTNNKNNEEKPDKPDTPVNDQKQVVVNLFHWSDCSHCQEEIEWLKEVEKRNDYIKVNYFEVTEYDELVTKVRDELGVLGDGVPLTVIGTDYILGFGDSTKARLMNLIDKYKDKDYCDIIPLIEQDKNTDDCYLQNN